MSASVKHFLSLLSHQQFSPKKDTDTIIPILKTEQSTHCGAHPQPQWGAEQTGYKPKGAGSIELTPWIHRTGITQALFRNTESRAPPQPDPIRTCISVRSPKDPQDTRCGSTPNCPWSPHSTCAVHQEYNFEQLATHQILTCLKRDHHYPGRVVKM